MVRHCSGGIILGFEQFRAKAGIAKQGAANESHVADVRMPTSWNQIEAGMIYSNGLPMLVFRELGVSGGIFDVDTSEVFVHAMPSPTMGDRAREDIDLVFQNWAAKVRTRYYEG